MKRTKELTGQSGLIIYNSDEANGSGWLYGLDRKKPNKAATVVWSTGGGWDHVSVSWSNRCPTWEEMCTVKDIFFCEDEAVVEYHPAKADYVNYHPYCLHLWRRQEGEMPVPPTWMVGPKQGQTVKEALNDAYNAMNE